MTCTKMRRMRWGITWDLRSLLPAALVGIIAVSAACGDDQSVESDIAEAAGGDADATTTTGLPACGEAKQLVIFATHGLITLGGDEYNRWTADYPDYSMAVRPGALDLVNAYHENGYDVLYTSHGTPDLDIQGTPYEEALTGWYEDEGFPLDDRARLFPGASDRRVAEELLSWARDGGTVHAAYTNADIEIPAFLSAGLPREQIYTVDAASGAEDTAGIPDDDLEAHLEDLGEPEPVCDLDD